MLRRVWGSKGMWGSVWCSRAVPAIFVASMAASSAYAATVELTSVTGTFQDAGWNVDYDNVKNVTYEALAANPRAHIRSESTESDSEMWWGNPRPVGSQTAPWNNFSPLGEDLLKMQSGYVFEGIATSEGFSTTDEAFTFGSFTHHNGAVWTNSATLNWVDFRIDIKGSVEGQDFSVSTLFRILHNETINPAQTCAAGGTQPCQDSVVFGDSLYESLPFVVGTMEYTLVLDGFVQSLDGEIVTGFFTPEYTQNSAMLRARLESRELPPIPLPAAGWLLIAGIGGLAAAARKKRRAA